MHDAREGAVALALIALLGAAGAGCESTERLAYAAERQQALGRSIDLAIIPAAQGFAGANTALVGKIEALCKGPTQPLVEAAQAGWRDLASSWNGLVVYNVGPLDDDAIFPSMIFIESMRQRGRDYTETVREEISRVLGDTDPLDQAFFERASFTTQGILALEVLLFEESSSAHQTDLPSVLAEYQNTPRKCEYLAGMARLLERRSKRVEAGWTQDFGGTGTSFAETLRAGFLKDGSASLPAVIAVLIEHLDYVKRRKLEGSLDAKLSGHAFINIEANLDAIERFFTPPGAPAAPGEEVVDFAFVMKARGDGAVVTALHSAVEAARQAAKSSDKAATVTAISALEGLLKRDVPAALGVSLGINFNDGD